MTKDRVGVAAMIAACIAALSLLVTPGAASADIDPGPYCKTYSDRVDGCFIPTDDWDDNPQIKWGSANSNLVMMWQAVLFVEHLFDPGCRTVEGAYLCFKGAQEIDGSFGKKTHHATKALQRRYGVGIDGQVGPKTWAAASNKLYQIDSSGYCNTYYESVLGGSLKLGRGNPPNKFHCDNNGPYPDDGQYNMVEAHVWYSTYDVRVSFWTTGYGAGGPIWLTKQTYKPVIVTEKY